MGFGLARARSCAKSVKVITGGEVELGLRACEGRDEPERTNDVRVVGMGSAEGRFTVGLRGERGAGKETGEWNGEDIGVDA